jgi:hypothetical protein
MTSIRNKIEKWFESLAQAIFHNRFKTILTMLVIIGAILSQLPTLTMDISTEGFMHPADPTLADYNAFRDQFGRDELIIVAITCPDVFDGRFLEKLKKLHEDLQDNVPYLEDITSLVNARNTRGETDRLIVEDLLENWPRTPEAMSAIKRRTMENPLYKNLLISENGRMATIILQAQTYSATDDDMDVLEGFEATSDMDPAGIDEANEKKYLTDSENSEMVTAVKKIANGYATPDFTIDIAGSSVVTHFLKHAMIKDIRKFLLLAVITVALFLFIMFRRISGVVLPLLIVMLSLLSTISLMAIFNVPIKLPTQILPSFMLAVSVGYSVHILAIFYHSFQKSRNREAAIVHAIGHSGLAVLMTAATTAGGLFSFSTSQVAPIADLGIFAGIGVLLAMAYTIILLPALLAIIPIKKRLPRTGPEQDSATDRLLAAVGRVTTTHPYKILIISAAILAVSIAGAMKIKFSHDILKWLPADNAARVATEKIDHDLKGSVALEIILDTGRENGLYDPDLLNRIEKTIAYLETLKVGNIFVGKAWSLTTILKETHRALNENRPAFYAISQDQNLIAQELLLFENSGSDDMEDFTDSQFSKVRMMAKVPFKNALAYTKFLKDLNHHLQKTFPDVKITTTGMIALLSGTLSNAIDSMGRSYLYALLVITVLMVLLIGRLRIGLLSMVPNLTPIIIILGIMGWFKIPMNLFTMLVGNIAIGLAVDDTIHFMHNFRRYFEESNDATAAVMETLHTTGRAMLVTSCVLSIGFFIFMFATMNNLFHFGLLTGLTIILALLSDYFIAPALMVVVNSKKQVKGGR